MTPSRSAHVGDVDRPDHPVRVAGMRVDDLPTPLHADGDRLVLPGTVRPSRSCPQISMRTVGTSPGRSCPVSGGRRKPPSERLGAEVPSCDSRAPAYARRCPRRRAFPCSSGATCGARRPGGATRCTAPGARSLGPAATAPRARRADAVAAARAALPGWSGATAYNRGQVLYRVAEMLQARRDRFAARSRREGRRAGAVVDAAVDRWVWYAGWTDKIATVLGSVQPGRGPVRQLLHAGADGRRSGCSRPPTRPLTGLVDVLAPVLATGVHRRRGRVGRAAAARRRAGRGARDVRRARRRGQPAHRPRRRAGAVAGRARRRRRAGSRRGARGRRRRPGARGGRYREARAAAAEPPASWPGCAPGRSSRRCGTRSGAEPHGGR